jgi:hypothetical protein
MITAHKTYGVKVHTYEMYGLSTDEKPTDVANTSTFYEMDTKKLFMFDETNKVWIEQ